MKRMMFTVCLIVIMLLFSISVSAYDTSYIEESLDTKSIYEAIPDKVLNKLESNFFNEEDIVETAESINSDSIINYVINTLKDMLFPTLKTFASLFSIIIFTSLINASKNTLSNENLSKAIGFITTIAVALCAFDIIKNSGDYIQAFLSNMDTLINALLPVMILLYTLGGNVASSIVSSASISFTLTVLNFIVQHLITPVISICFGLTLAGEIGSIKGIKQVTKSTKNIITFTLTAILTLFSIFLLFKTNLSIASDGVAARTVKFAGSFIPIIGSPLGESVRSIMSGLSLIKSSTGFVGITILFLLTVPTILHIFLTKISFDLSSSLAYTLGSEKEGNILKEIASLMNYMLAITVSIVILFLFELIIFVTVSPSLGAA